MLVLLKGGREAAHTNAAIGAIIHDVLERHGVAGAVQLVSTREEVAQLLAMNDLISLVIPRGSNEMVQSIQSSTRIPVLGHADGICHVYVDAVRGSGQGSSNRGGFQSAISGCLQCRGDSAGAQGLSGTSETP